MTKITNKITIGIATETRNQLNLIKAQELKRTLNDTILFLIEKHKNTLLVPKEAQV